MKNLLRVIDYLKSLMYVNLVMEHLEILQFNYD